MNLIGEWGRVLASTLADVGLRDVVVSPGSRSTPFVMAVDAEPRLAVQVLLDERSAAFFALGKARFTGRPVALLCTSGTAAANYLPAVVEADAAGIPLVVLTADRPHSSMACGANQTIEQLSLFAGRARFVLDLGSPDASVTAMRALRRAVIRAVDEASGPDAGPVHLNLRAAKPLEPGPPLTENDREAERAANATLGAPVTRTAKTVRHPSDAVLDRLSDVIARARRPVLLAGPAHPGTREATERVIEFCRQARVPLLAESTSQLRFVGRRRDGLATFDSFDLAWRTPSGRRAIRPDLIVQLGAFPVSRGYADLLEDDDPPARLVICERGWPDPIGTAVEVCRADVEPLFRGLTERIRTVDRDEAFIARSSAAEAALSHVVEGVVVGSSLGEGAVARTLVSAMPRGGVVVVGNSLPVRQLDLVCPGRLGDFAVVSQRGVSGIDGLVSGAAGVASVSNRPTALYVGDISFLHDVGGLFAARDIDVPLVMVVANNDGGRIFEQLPVARAGVEASALSHFTTPHGLSLGPAAALYGHRHTRADTGIALRNAIEQALSMRGCTVVEAVVPSAAARAEAEALVEAAEAALSEVATGLDG